MFCTTEETEGEGGAVKSIDTIYLTSIKQKAQRTYRRALEGAGVCVLWSYMVEETGEAGENHRPWADDHYPVTCRHRDSI